MEFGKMERYTDEKHPESSVFLDELEQQQPRPKRPLWRRFARFFLAFASIWFLAVCYKNTFYPALDPDWTPCTRGRLYASPKPIPPTLEVDVTDPNVPTQHFTFPSSLKTFYIKQESLHHIPPSRVEVVGNFIVHGCDKATNISAHFKIDSTDPSLRSKVEIEARKDGLIFKLDPFTLASEKINATVYLVVPKGDEYKLDSLKISTIQLPIWIKDTFTTVVNSTSVSAVSGWITSYGKSENDNLLDINNLRLHSVSGGITGEFPLNHALDIQTTSGDLVANVVSSDLPENIGWFKTSTVSGDQHVKFLGDLNPRPLYSKHNSVSGDISIVYPEDWQGGLKLKTTSGHIDVEGKGTKVIKKDKGLVGRFWKVIKGEGKSRGSIATVSGRIDVFIGEKEE